MSHLMWKVNRRALHPISALKPHQEGHWCVQEMEQWPRDNRQVDVLPLERKQ